MGKYIKILIYLVISFIVVTTIFAINTWLGIGVMVAGLALVVFFLRANLISAYAFTLYSKDIGKSFLWFERALKTGRMRPQDVLIYAYLLIREGVLDKSERLINKTLFIEKDKLPNDFVQGSHLNLSIIKWKRGDLTGAIEELEEVYNTGFRTTVMYGTLGTYYLLNGQLAKAMEFNKEALEFNDTDPSIRDNLALNYFLMGDIKSADEIYDQLIDEEPSFIEPYYNYGRVLENMGEYEAAMANYEKAMEMPIKFLSTVTKEQVESAYNGLKEKLDAESNGEDK